MVNRCNPRKNYSNRIDTWNSQEQAKIAKQEMSIPTFGKARSLFGRMNKSKSSSRK